MAKRCPKCGIDYPDRDNFCMECGGRLGGVPESPKPPAEPEIPKIMEANVSHLGRRLKAVEEGLGRLGSEIRDLKASEPEGLELLRSAVEGATNRISRMDSGVKGISRRLRENEKHVEGIENITASFARRQEMEELGNGISARFGGMEKDMKTELNKISGEISGNMEARLGPAVKRVEKLEAELARLMGSLEEKTAKKLEGFKTGFNQKVNKNILELRREVAQRTDIINKLRDNLEGQIRLHEERYSQFEGVLKKELGDIDNFKQGLTVQQEEGMKGFRTELLEGMGKIRKLEEDLALQQEKRMLAMEDALREGLEGLGQESRTSLPAEAGPDSGELLELKGKLEEAVRDIKKLGEDLVLQQQARLLAMGLRIDEVVRELKQGKGTNINPKEKI